MKTNKLIALVAVAFLSTASCFAEQISLNWKVVANTAASPIIEYIERAGTFEDKPITIDDTMNIRTFIGAMQEGIMVELKIQISIEKAKDDTQQIDLIDRQKGLNPDRDDNPPTLQALGVKDGDTLTFWVE